MDRGDDYKHGFAEAVWQRAKDEARAAMIKRASRGAPMTYTELCSEMTSIRFDPHDARLHHLLGQISTEEDGAGRGMLTAVVVQKDNGKPGAGFFELAEDLGRSVIDRDQIWVEEMKRLKSYHAAAKRRQ